MGAPIDLRSLPPDLQQRYGVGRKPWGTIIAILGVVLLFAAGLVFAAMMLGRGSVQSKLLTWKVVGPDRVDVQFEVRSTTDEPVSCVLRAQDSQRADLGYATVPITFTDGYAQLTYPLHTLATAYTAEVLGCDVGTPRVPGPQFPAGVAPPSQPWTG